MIRFMYISETRKFIAIHNQKTGSTSIHHHMQQTIPDLAPLLPRHTFASDGIGLLGREAWEEYYSFGFVRNPWARLVSWYSMIIERPGRGTNNTFWEYVRHNSHDFTSFIRNCTAEITEPIDGYMRSRSFVKNQVDYFTDSRGAIAVSRIGRYENLDDDFNSILQDLGMPQHKLAWLNPTKSKDYRSYYTDETAAIVAKRFEKDIARFGYRFNA